MKTSKTIQSCITCSDSKTCRSTDKLTKKHYLAGDNKYCRHWRVNRNAEELKKANLDATIRFTEAKREPLYKMLLAIDPNTQDIRARDIISRIPNFAQERTRLQQWADKLSGGYKLTFDDFHCLNRYIDPIRTEYMPIDKAFKKKIRRSNSINVYKTVYEPSVIKQSISLDKPLATAYAEVLSDYMNNVLKVKTCLLCGKPTSRPRYCSDRCSTRARVRRHRSK